MKDAERRRNPELWDGQIQTGEGSQVGVVVGQLRPADVGGEG